MMFAFSYWQWAQNGVKCNDANEYPAKQDEECGAQIREPDRVK